MKIKLQTIHGCKTAKQVLVQRVEIEDEENFPVEISAWHNIDEVEQFQYEVIIFPTRVIAEQFVADYSEFAANEFADSFQN